MEKLLSEIETALHYELYYIALQSTLTLPDICGALTSDNGQASKQKYVDWYDKYYQPKYRSQLSGNDCYSLRCAHLHQGSFQHSKSSFNKVAFVNFTKLFMSDNTVVIHNADGTTTRIYTLHISAFCENMIETVRGWLISVKDNPNFKKNYSNMVKVHDEGLPPICQNVPVIY